LWTINVIVCSTYATAVIFDLYHLGKYLLTVQIYFFLWKLPRSLHFFFKSFGNSLFSAYLCSLLLKGFYNNDKKTSTYNGSLRLVLRLSGAGGCEAVSQYAEGDVAARGVCL
jgi:hypothetical protein